MDLQEIKQLARCMTPNNQQSLLADLVQSLSEVGCNYVDVKEYTVSFSGKKGSQVIGGYSKIWAVNDGVASNKFMLGHPDAVIETIGVTDTKRVFFSCA